MHHGNDNLRKHEVGTLFSITYNFYVGMHCEFYRLDSHYDDHRGGGNSEAFKWYHRDDIII